MTEVTKADPMVMGVAMPIDLTVSAAKQVGEAWSTFAMAMMDVVKGKLAKVPKAASAAAAKADEVMA